MKNLLRSLFVATLAVFFYNQGFAQTTEKSGSDNAASATAVQCKFVDKNNDGICDNHELKGKSDKCDKFVDKDGNGICDNCAGTGNCGKNANCQGKCNQQRQGCCGKGPANGCGQGKGQGTCCPNKQGLPNVTPSETPDPKK